jgi:hypothetical protein
MTAKIIRPDCWIGKPEVEQSGDTMLILGQKLNGGVFGDVRDYLDKKTSRRIRSRVIDGCLLARIAPQPLIQKFASMQFREERRLSPDHAPGRSVGGMI